MSQKLSIKYVRDMAWTQCTFVRSTLYMIGGSRLLLCEYKFLVHTLISLLFCLHFFQVTWCTILHFHHYLHLIIDMDNRKFFLARRIIVAHLEQILQIKFRRITTRTLQLSISNINQKCYRTISYRQIDTTHTEIRTQGLLNTVAQQGMHDDFLVENFR